MSEKIIGEKLVGKIVAFTDTEIGIVVAVTETGVFIQGANGYPYKLTVQELGWGRDRKRAILEHLYGAKCMKCGATENLTIDHIRPRKGGRAGAGASGLENLQLLCCKCNVEKDRQMIDYRPFHPGELFEGGGGN